MRQIFPSLDHEILKALIVRKLDDPDLVRFIDLILASSDGVLDEAYRMVFFRGDDLLAVTQPRGLPIGNLTSQFWTNVYLNPFDHFVRRELGCAGYVRYVDDFLLFADDKRKLWNWLRAIEWRLVALRLTMHAGAHPRPVTEGVPFLGFVVFPDRRRLKRRKGIHFQRRLARTIREHALGRRRLTEVAALVSGWVNHARSGNTVGLRKAVLRRALIGPGGRANPPQ